MKQITAFLLLIGFYLPTAYTALAEQISVQGVSRPPSIQGNPLNLRRAAPRISSPSGAWWTNGQSGSPSKPLTNDRLSKSYYPGQNEKVVDVEMDTLTPEGVVTQKGYHYVPDMEAEQWIWLPMEYRE